MILAVCDTALSESVITTYCFCKTYYSRILLGCVKNVLLSNIYTGFEGECKFLRSFVEDWEVINVWNFQIFYVFGMLLIIILPGNYVAELSGGCGNVGNRLVYAVNAGKGG